MRSLLLVIAILCTLFSPAQLPATRFEQTNGMQTPAYAEIISWWQKLDAASGKVKLLTRGMTDAGLPLHLVVISENGDYDFAAIRKRNKSVILVNNGIHPGEPDGIDASMLLARDIVANKYALPSNIVLAIIPVYNIGGSLNRSDLYRVDQNGPAESGFRGNSQNLDLNRDFIKCDSKEARAFAAIFHETDPDVFVDNHVSNGADYQHVMTLLTTQHNKLGGAMGEYLNKQFEPALYKSMSEKGYDLIPYVNHFGETPESGWPEFWDSPRYSSGYATLWQTFAFLPETHKLKPYRQRVDATLKLMQSFIEFTAKNSTVIKQLRQQSRDAIKTASGFPVSWSLDSTSTQSFLFKGYKPGKKTSEISGLPRLYYDRNKRFEVNVPVWNQYKPKTIVQKPIAYIIPQGWWKIIDLLQLNKVVMTQLKKDTTIEVSAYYIADYKPAARQYEMHHPNSQVALETKRMQLKFRKGDWYIPMNQAANRFLTETLEPQAEDSYFAWNYFDAILGQKEGYSAYVFEETAAAFLNKNPALKTLLKTKQQSDSAFAKNHGAQLDFIYEHSPYYEPDFRRYPVYRVE